MTLDRLVKSAAAIFTQVEDMAKWAAQGVFTKSDAPEFELFTPFDLDVFRKAFNIQDSEKFLTEKPFAALTEIIDDQIGRLRLVAREGTRMHLIAMPCSPSGKRFSPAHFNEDLDTTIPYLTILRSNPDDPSGLCTGFGFLAPQPLIRILPEEINQKCSFIVKYPPSDPKDIKSLQIDRDYLVEQFAVAYANLQTALKPAKKKA